MDLGTVKSEECWDQCKAQLGADLVATDYDESKGECCCRNACECKILSSTTCYGVVVDDTPVADVDDLGQCDGSFAMEPGGVCSELPAVLQIVSLTVRKDKKCTKEGGTEMNPGYEICAGDPPTKDVCQGDSGGPLVSKDGGYTQVGIVSRGNGCASYSGIYADVAAYRPWIDKEIGPSCKSGGVGAFSSGACSCEDDAGWHKTDAPEKNCAWVGGDPETRCAVKGPGFCHDYLRASYACKKVCGGTCQDSASWTKKGTEDWKNCAWVSVYPEARCSVWGEMPGDEARVLASAACLGSCA